MSRWVDWTDRNLLRKDGLHVAAEEMAEEMAGFAHALMGTGLKIELLVTKLLSLFCFEYGFLLPRLVMGPKWWSMVLVLYNTLMRFVENLCTIVTDLNAHEKVGLLKMIEYGRE